MDPGIYNFTIYQGATFAKQIVLKENAVVRVLTGYTGRMMIRDKNTGSLVVELTSANGKLVITEPLGQINLILPATETSEYNFIKGLYDIEIINGPLVERVLQGEVTLNRNVTK